MKRGMALFLAITIILSLCVGCSSAPSTPTADLPEEEIFTKTIHDFKNRRIENLDEQENTNFIVYAKGVEEITVSSTTNTLVETDYENLSYTFTNADKTLLSMKKGDVFFAPISESCPEGVTIKVKEIVQSGDRVTVFSQELGFGDMFEYIDIFMDVPLEQPSLRQEGIYRLSAEQGPITIPINKTFSGKVEISSGAAKLSFETYITVQSVTVKLRFSREHMQLFCDIWTDTTYGGSADFEGEWNPDKWTKTLTVLPLRIGALINVPVEINAVASASGKTDSHVEFKESKRTGFTSTVSKQNCAYQPIDQVLTPMSFANSYFGQMEAQANLGLEIKPTLSLGFLGRFYASCTAGINITAHMAPPVEIPEDGSDKIHDCDLCVDGDVNWFLNLGVGIETRLSEVLEEIVMIEDAPELLEEMDVEDELQSDITAARFGGKITDFYVTMRDGNWDFGWGECINSRYKTTVTITDSGGNPAANAKLTAYLPDGRQEEAAADQEGIAVVYLPVGENELSGATEKETGRCTVQIEDQPAEAEISLRENKLYISVNITTSAYSSIQNTLASLFPDAVFTSDPYSEGASAGDVCLTVEEGSSEVAIVDPSNTSEVFWLPAPDGFDASLFQFSEVDSGVVIRRQTSVQLSVGPYHYGITPWVAGDNYGTFLEYSVEAHLYLHSGETTDEIFCEVVPGVDFTGVVVGDYCTNPAYQDVLLRAGIPYLQMMKPYVERLLADQSIS